MSSFCNTDQKAAARQEINRLTSEYLAQGKDILRQSAAQTVEGEL